MAVRDHEHPRLSVISRRPARMIATRSATRSTSDRMWEDSSTAAPASRVPAASGGIPAGPAGPGHWSAHPAAAAAGRPEGLSDHQGRRRGVRPGRRSLPRVGRGTSRPGSPSADGPGRAYPGPSPPPSHAHPCARAGGGTCQRLDARPTTISRTPPIRKTTPKPGRTATVSPTAQSMSTAPATAATSGAPVHRPGRGGDAPGRSWGAGPGGGRVSVPGSWPPISSRNGGYRSVISAAYPATRSTHRFRPPGLAGSSDAAPTADLLADRPGEAGQDSVQGREDQRVQVRQHRDLALIRVESVPSGSNVTVSWPDTGGTRYFAVTWNSSSETSATENRGAASSASQHFCGHSSLAPATTRVVSSSAPSCMRLSRSCMSAFFTPRGPRSAVPLDRFTPTGTA